ncbi:MAG: hypothetical protein PHQ74_10270 [Crocinitomicaceae bacterium]|nr:hypothetical protein [Crocinitomicaceae bacterium]
MNLFFKIFCFMVLMMSSLNVNCQDTLFVNRVFKESEKTVVIRTLNEYSLASCLSERVEQLLVNCGSYSQNLEGYTIQSIVKDQKKIILISPTTYIINAENPLLDGIVFVNSIPFFCYKSSELESVLNATNRSSIVHFTMTSDGFDEVILSNLLDERFVTKETFQCNGDSFDLIIENCKKTKRK